MKLKLEDIKRYFKNIDFDRIKGYASSGVAKVKGFASTFIYTIRARGVPFIKSAVRQIKDKALENKKLTAGLVGIMAGTIVIVCIAGHFAVSSDYDEEPSDTIATVQKEIWGTPSLIAEIDGHRYEVKEKSGEQYLFKDDKKSKKVKVSNLPAMDFNMGETDTISSISSYQDTDKPGGVGSHIYHGKTYIWQRYLAGLKESGYKVTDYIMAGSYADIYISKGSDRYRFLVVKESSEDSTLIFGRYSGKGPELGL